MNRVGCYKAVFMLVTVLSKTEDEHVTIKHTETNNKPQTISRALLLYHVTPNADAVHRQSGAKGAERSGDKLREDRP